MPCTLSVVTIQIHITDLAALKAACEELGLTLDEFRIVGDGIVLGGLVKDRDGSYRIVARMQAGSAQEERLRQVKQRYAVCKAEREARQKGLMVQRKASGRQMQLVITGR